MLDEEVLSVLCVSTVLGTPSRVGGGGGGVPPSCLW